MEYFLIIISAIFVNNIVLAQFLGICPFLGVSNKLSTATGMSMAVCFVITLATLVTYLINKYLLVPFQITFLQTIAFILVIAALVQMVEIVLKKVSPSLYQALGIFLPLITTNCAVLGVAINGLSMGLATLFVLVLSNMAISAIAPVVPDKVHIPVYIVVIATFVTLLQLLMQAYTPAMYETLGLFIPLIVVNCIVLGRAEAYASKHGVVESACDGLGVGLGFTCSLTVLGLVREILGSGSVFGYNFIGGNDGMLAFVMAPGAFLCLGYLMVLFNKFLKKN